MRVLLALGSSALCCSAAAWKPYSCFRTRCARKADWIETAASDTAEPPEPGSVNGGEAEPELARAG